MSDILYIQTEKNVEVHSPEVYVQDVASLSCSNGKVLNRNKARKLFTIPNEKPGRYVISALEIVDLIQRNEESVDVTHIGEANFILTYETQKHAHQFYSWLKTIFVSLVTFFGGAFSIMTFNTDVDTAGLFMKVYEQITGRVSNGKTILELSYSIGIGLGVIFFFNHFGGRKITEDPTPMEVEMRVYEDDVNKTLIEQEKERNENKMLRELLAGIVGLCGGMVVATALAAFIIGLGMIPRYAGVTHTGNHLLFYENSLMLGSFLGNLFLLYRIHINLGIWCVALVGIGFGIFLGSWVIALGEVVNVFAIMARRVGLTKGAGLVILSLAVGKILGSLVQFFC